MLNYLSPASIFRRLRRVRIGLTRRWGLYGIIASLIVASFFFALGHWLDTESESEFVTMRLATVNREAHVTFEALDDSLGLLTLTITVPDGYRFVPGSVGGMTDRDPDPIGPSTWRWAGLESSTNPRQLTFVLGLAAVTDGGIAVGELLADVVRASGEPFPSGSDNLALRLPVSIDRQSGVSLSAHLRMPDGSFVESGTELTRFDGLELVITIDNRGPRILRDASIQVTAESSKYQTPGLGSTSFITSELALPLTNGSFPAASYSLSFVTPDPVEIELATEAATGSGLSLEDAGMFTISTIDLGWHAAAIVVPLRISHSDIDPGNILDELDFATELSLNDEGFSDKVEVRVGDRINVRITLASEVPLEDVRIEARWSQVPDGVTIESSLTLAGGATAFSSALAITPPGVRLSYERGSTIIRQLSPGGSETTIQDISGISVLACGGLRVSRISGSAVYMTLITTDGSSIYEPVSDPWLAVIPYVNGGEGESNALELRPGDELEIKVGFGPMANGGWLRDPKLDFELIEKATGIEFLVIGSSDGNIDVVQRLSTRLAPGSAIHYEPDSTFIWMIDEGWQNVGDADGDSPLMSDPGLELQDIGGCTSDIPMIWTSAQFLVH